MCAAREASSEASALLMVARTTALRRVGVRRAR